MNRGNYVAMGDYWWVAVDNNTGQWAGAGASSADSIENDPVDVRSQYPAPRYTVNTFTSESSYTAFLLNLAKKAGGTVTITNPNGQPSTTVVSKAPMSTAAKVAIGAAVVTGLYLAFKK